jgi:hypothetical protein
MTARMIAGFGAALLGLTASAASGQESSNRVAANTDWSVFVEENPKECWGVSAPKETVNTKDGQPASVRRGDILLFVTYTPGNLPAVSFTGGYQFALDSPITLVVGTDTFTLVSAADDPATSDFNENEWAWPTKAEEDAAILTSLRAGSAAVVTARSGRGTQTQDTFSLLGVSGALDEAAKRCAG